MSDFIILLDTAGILLIPLLPAWIVYSKIRSKTEQSDTATGEYESSWLTLGKFKFSFSAFGGSATYLTLLVMAVVVFVWLQDINARKELLRDRQAWLVEVPVILKDADGSAIEAPTVGLEEANVLLQPDDIEATANSLRFWVISHDGRFPTATISIPFGVEARVVDLNNERMIQRDLQSREMEATDPVWIEVTDESYDEKYSEARQ